MTVQCTMSLQTANQNWFKPPSRQSIVNPMCMQKNSAEKYTNCIIVVKGILLIATKNLHQHVHFRQVLTFHSVALVYLRTRKSNVGVNPVMD